MRDCALGYQFKAVEGCRYCSFWIYFSLIERMQTGCRSMLVQTYVLAQRCNLTWMQFRLDRITTSYVVVWSWFSVCLGFSFCLNVRYSWIGPPIETHEKLIPGRTRRATTIPRPPLKNSGRENSDLPGKFLSDLFLTSFFKITYQIMSEQKRTRKNRICFVEYSCSEVSGPSEVPRFVRGLSFYLF